ncbi:MAG: hydantoinase B/oxoprolinase family protein [Porticoccaceae bacterium]|nr:hydantoinase B/oxoprolinase family protein [Porticoccaceae bacterium]
MNEIKAPSERSLIEQFLDDNVLFLGPDPEIMADHTVSIPTAQEVAAVEAWQDRSDDIHLIRNRLQTACNESFDMVEQMGAAPGAKWGDLIAGIFSCQGDLSLSSAGGVLIFSVLAQHPVKFALKYWKDDPTVGINEGDIFMHNDARYGNIHNTDQSLSLPVFHKGEIVCFVGSIVHEGENGACEPGGMPGGAESPYDEGLKMPPLKVGENFEFRKDLLTFLQNSVREPKLQFEGMKSKLHACLRIKKRVEEVIRDYGVDAFLATIRGTLSDTEAEVRRRLRTWPNGKVQSNVFADSTLRENVLIKIRCEVTKQDDELIIDLRGSSPEFLNRANNTVLASMKGMLAQLFLMFIWPDLPRNQAVFAPIKVLTDPGSALNCSPEAPNAQSMMTFFPAFTAVQSAVPKLLFAAGYRSTDIVACWYNMITTFVYGGFNQHQEFVGNVCADLNGMGGAARATRDGEHSVAPIFASMADIGEQELIEEEVPMMKLVPHKVMVDNCGFGKQRGGHGYQQIVTHKDTQAWGYMVNTIGAKFPSTYGIFGGYAPGCYPLCKVKGVNVFDVMKDNRELMRFTIDDIMNEQPFPDATYSSHHAGLQFELAEQGELYMITQGGGGGYGDVLERDPADIASDWADGIVSKKTIENIYFVVMDYETGALDKEATDKARAAERVARLARAKPFKEFAAEWTKAKPPEGLPYYGSWDDPKVLHLGTPDKTCPADAIESVMMPDPKDVEIAALKAELKALKGGA